MQRVSQIQVYVTGMMALAIVLLASIDWAAFGRLSQPDLVGLGTLTLLALFSEQQAVRIGAGKVSGGSSVGFLPLFTLLLLYGPSIAVGTMVLIGPAVEYGIRRKEPLRANFNIGQYIAATAIGGIAFTWAGGQGLLQFAEAAVTELVWPFALFAVVVLLFNNAAVTLAIALSQKMSFAEVWSNLVTRSGANILSDLLVAPVALAVAALYVQIGTVGLVLAILPLLFIRHAYLTTFRLKKANRDLLNALVKAIETRDPYTSGHSLRVSALAKAIGEGCGMHGQRLEALETAALLHDIGKIEGVYTEILKKPDALSVEERNIIESHVQKGAELLESMTSFGDNVIQPVLHHHEHFDGSGYPAGLQGHEIPLGGRVIKLCDAIDAMLSDRPYRRALKLPEVYEQLRIFSGRQFDPDLVSLVIEKDLVPIHARGIEADRAAFSLANDRRPKRPVRRVRPERQRLTTS